jgi:hypothetical protein
LIIAELVVHRRVRSAVKHFVQRRIVTSEDVPRFYGTDKPTSYPLPRHFSTPPAPAIPLPRLFTAQ